MVDQVNDKQINYAEGIRTLRLFLSHIGEIDEIEEEEEEEEESR